MKLFRLSRSIITLCLATLAFAAPLAAQTESENTLMRTKMLADIDTMHDLFAIRYAPMEWKQHFAAWTLEAATETAKARVMELETPTTKEFHRILRDFCHSMKDYHVSIYFHSTEQAHLPFDVMGAEGRYFVSHIDESVLSKSVFPFEVGDEILSFGFRPIGDVIAELVATEERGATAETDQRMAEMTLTHRVGAKGHYVPKGGIRVTGKTQNGQTQSVQLLWSYCPERVNTRPQHLIDHGARVEMSMMLTADETRQDMAGKLVRFTEMLSPEMEHLKAISPQSFDSKHGIGDREGFLPPLGRITGASDPEDPFHAYICETPDGTRVGYVRIPTYSAGLSGETEAFGELIDLFEEKTDVLVFDQMNNGGGYPHYGYCLLSMLTDKPLPTPKNRFKLIQEDIISFLEISDMLSLVTNDNEAQAFFGETYLGLPVNVQLVQFFKLFLDMMIDEWSAGKSMTDPVHLMMIDEINPHYKHRYTKPVLCLINEKDFSAADFIPAVLQDNGRAVLMGTRTAGAGGAVRASSPTLYFGVAMVSHTITLAERTNSFRPIENLGVEPDVPYTLTVDDLQNDFAPFVEAIQAQVSSMVN